ncbi:precorrin-6y C5,15-methyltransferase (decarboxylating) subunit CbiE [Maricurvus nonylphenolicus]|uniref:precorrin-6y C5,15-methyltransferase (decarboxylating) subunit CbiE n=1 Tax=Maricurvus nonylphenolicus TaxID=1008307 RepID=UPI0036F40392
MTDILIHIVGLGVTDQANLSGEATAALQGAGLVMGSERQLAVVEHLLSDSQTTMVLPAFKQLGNTLETLQREGLPQLVVLASGDPLFYGIGRWFANNFDKGQLRFYPAISSIQAACHQLGLSQQDVDVISLHGRPLFTLRRKLKQQKTLVILTDKNSTPSLLAQECAAAGFDQSTLWVCETLGYPEQKVSEFSVAELLETNQSFDPLHVTVIQTRGIGRVFPEFPGIEDTAFVTDKGSGKGMITKREVRLGILSLLQPAAGDVIWDVGAGCGSVAVELAYWNEKARVCAIEHHAERQSCLEENQQRFGVVDNLELINDRAPACLKDLPTANKVFIGGSDGELPQLLDQVWQQLPEWGVLVASAVMEPTRQQLLQFLQTHQSDAETETLQIAVSKGETLAGQLVYKPNLPVTLFKLTKQSCK